MRATIGVRNVSGLVANLFERDRRVRDGVRRLNDRVGHEQDALTAALCPYKSGRTLRLKRLTFSPDGLTYAIGWREADYRAEGVAFYLKWIVWGTRHRAGNPFPFTARDLVLPRYRRDLRAVVRGGLRRSGFGGAAAGRGP